MEELRDPFIATNHKTRGKTMKIEAIQTKLYPKENYFISLRAVSFF